jgi:hypothetical protein
MGSVAMGAIAKIGHLAFSQPAPDDTRALVASEARQALTKLGQPSAVYLCEFFGKAAPDDKVISIMLLAQIGSPACDCFLSLLETNERDNMRYALLGIVLCGQECSAAMSAVRTVLASLVATSSDRALIARCVRALTRLGHYSEDVFDLAVELADSNERTIRQDAIDALCHYGDSAFPLLARALSDPEEDIRKLAVRGVGKMSAGARLQEAEEALRAALRDSSRAVREEAEEALSAMGSQQ